MYRREEGDIPATACLKMVRNEHNTPVIINYSFWQMTAENPRAVYACVNRGEVYCPREFANQAVRIDADIIDALLCRLIQSNAQT